MEACRHERNRHVPKSRQGGAILELPSVPAERARVLLNRRASAFVAKGLLIGCNGIRSPNDDSSLLKVALSKHLQAA